MGVEDSTPYDRPRAAPTYLTAKEAAHRLSRSPKTIRRWVKTGYLRAAKVQRTWLIAPDQIETLLSWYGRPFPYGVIIHRRWEPPLYPTCPACGELQRAIRERG